MKYILALFLAICVAIGCQAETYAVCVGIAKYASPKVENLAKSEDDAKAMAKFLRKGTGNVVTITGKYATKEQILKTLRSQFSKAGKGDKIIFYFSGHGFPGGFCPHEMEGIKDGLSYAEVVEVMKDSRATSKFIFADACNSGAIRQKKSAAKPQPGDILLFLSSRGNEYSIESPWLANGFFTKYLLRGLGGAADADGNRRITASELFAFVSNGVKNSRKTVNTPLCGVTFPTTW